MADDWEYFQMRVAGDRAVVPQAGIASSRCRDCGKVRVTMYVQQRVVGSGCLEVEHALQLAARIEMACADITGRQ